MSTISGSGADRVAAFENALIYHGGATTSDSERAVKVTKREMEKALPSLTQAGPLDAQSRMDVWKSMSRLLLTDGARQALKTAIGVPVAPKVPDTPSGKLAGNLQKLAKGLFYTSESDYPYTAIHRTMDPRTPLTPATFKHLMGLPPGHAVRMESAEDFFRDHQKPEYVSDPAERQKYAALEAAMKRDLKDLKLIYGGPDDQIEAPVYIVGRAKDGSLVGLESTRIWT